MAYKDKKRMREYNRAYYARARERERARVAKWRLNNPDKVKEYSKKYAATNHEKVKKNIERWRANNYEKMVSYSRAYYASHPVYREKAKIRAHKHKKKFPEKARLAVKRWRETNPQYRRIENNKRRGGNSISKDIVAQRYKLQRGKCACGCAQPLGNDYHLDHIMPLALGGTNTDDNMQLLRAKCNLEKHAKHPVDFMQSRGFLL